MSLNNPNPIQGLKLTISTCSQATKFFYDRSNLKISQWLSHWQVRFHVFVTLLCRSTKNVKKFSYVSGIKSSSSLAIKKSGIIAYYNFCDLVIYNRTDWMSRAVFLFPLVQIFKSF